VRVRPFLVLDSPIVHGLPVDAALSPALGSASVRTLPSTFHKCPQLGLALHRFIAELGIEDLGRVVEICFLHQEMFEEVALLFEAWHDRMMLNWLGRSPFFTSRHSKGVETVAPGCGRSQ
jgi:hypothetical protein